MPHVKTVEYESPLCTGCGERKCYRKAWKKDGTPQFHSKCNFCRCKGDITKYRSSYGYGNRSVKRRRKNRKPYCEKCGFVAEHICQLDLDHIDGNHKNNEPTNLQTLCANCHRLKTYINRDWEHDLNREVK